MPLKLDLIMNDQASAVLQKFGSTTQSVMRQSESSVAGFTSRFTSLPSLIAQTASAMGLLAAGKSIVDTAMSAERMVNALKAVSGSSEAASKEIQFIQKEADLLGLSLTTVSGDYTKMAAAAMGTTMSGQGVRDIFSAVAEAATVLGLSASETSGAVLAIGQMMSKGTVQAEELRGQLGERLPGAFQIASRAMGVSTAQLGEMLKNGEVMADDFLPRFARELHKTFAGALPDATQSAQANINRFYNQLYDLKMEFAGSGFMDLALQTLSSISETMKDPALKSAVHDISVEFSAWGGFLRDAAGAARELKGFLDPIADVALRIPGVDDMLDNFNKNLFNMGSRWKEYSEAMNLVSQDLEKSKWWMFEFFSGSESSKKIPIIEPSSYKIPIIEPSSYKTKPPPIDKKALEKAIKEAEKTAKAIAAMNDEADKRMADLGYSKQENAAKNLDAMRDSLEKITQFSLPEQEQAVARINQQYDEMRGKLADIYATGRTDLSSDQYEKLDSDLMARQAKDLEDLARQHDKTNAVAMAGLTNQLTEIDSARSNYQLSEAAAAQQRIPLLEQELELTRRIYDQIKGNSPEEQLLREEELSKILQINDALDAQQRLLADRTAWGGAEKALHEYRDTVTDTGAVIHDSLSGAFRGAEDSLLEFYRTGELSFANLGKIAEDFFARLMVQKTMLALVGDGSGSNGLLTSGISWLWGALGGGGAASTGTELSGESGFYAAAGGVLNGHWQPLQSFAAGSPRIDQPTLGLVGEGHYPEAIVPLPDGRSIPVSMQGGNAASNVTVNVINQAAGTRASTRERRDNIGGRVIEVLIEQIKGSIAGDITRGDGTIPAALGRTYGLNRAAGAY